MSCETVDVSAAAIMAGTDAIKILVFCQLSAKYFPLATRPLHSLPGFCRETADLLR
jgi:hypothetical protein